MRFGFPSGPVRSSKASERHMVRSSIPQIIFGSLLGSLTAMVSVAGAAEPEADPSVGSAAPVAPQRDTVTVDQAPGVNLPAQESPEILPANPTADPEADPEAPVVAQVSTSERAAEPANEASGPWSLQAGVAGARGVQGPDPWMTSVAVGVAWTHDWLRMGLEAGWDHAVVRHPDGMTTVNYDATPLRLVFAAQNSVVMGGFRAGVAEYRVTSQQQPYWELTPLVGPFLAAKFPIAGRIRGLLVGGFDYFGRRTQLSTGGFDTAYSTPQVAPYVGVIVEGS